MGVNIGAISKPRNCRVCAYNDSDCWCGITRGAIDREDYSNEKECPIKEVPSWTKITEDARYARFYGSYEIFEGMLPTLGKDVWITQEGYGVRKAYLMNTVYGDLLWHNTDGGVIASLVDPSITAWQPILKPSPYIGEE